MKYKIKKEYKGEEFWTIPKAPSGYRTTRAVRTCKSCGKCSVASSGPDGVKLLCNEVTEYVGLYDTGLPSVYSRQPFYTFALMTCDEHKFQHEIEKEEKEILEKE